jgi:hypothetical protein
MHPRRKIITRKRQRSYEATDYGRTATDRPAICNRMFAYLEGNPVRPLRRSGLNLKVKTTLYTQTLFRGMPPGYYRSVSRSLEPSLQSSLQLSLTVLVRYRSGGIVFSLGWSLPPSLKIALSSNPTRFVRLHRPVRRPQLPAR